MKKTAGVPPHILAGIRRYVDDRLQPGGFMLAVLSNDLKQACARADSEAEAALVDIVTFLYNEVPSQCWGSPERVDAWLLGSMDPCARCGREGTMIDESFPGGVCEDEIACAESVAKAKP